MSEELLQRSEPRKIGENWFFYNIGSTTINQLKERNIIRSIDYGDIERKKPDGIIMEYKKVIAVIEYKLPEKFDTPKKKKDAIAQEIEVAKKLRAKLIIATDGQKTIWINVKTGNKVESENGDEFKYNFNLEDSKLQETIRKVLSSISGKNDKILPVELVNPANLAKQVWQDIWIASGKTPEICLYTFVELFIFKYLSDLGILTGIYSFDNLFSLYKKNNSPKDVLRHYARIVRQKIKELFPESELDKTTIINGTIFVNEEQGKISIHYETVFEDVIRKFEKNGKLENIDPDFKSKLFESFLKESISRKNWGQYFTPIKVVRAINQMVGEPKEDMKICDPACGVGKFPLEFIKNKIDDLFEIKNDKIIQKIWITGFDKGFDKEEQKTIILAKANMLIYFCDIIKKYQGITEEFAKLFNKSFVLKTSRLGTLSDLSHENKYDLILTNPPYVISGSKGLKKEINKNTKLKKFYSTDASGLEGLFMEWIIKALKPTGKAFIVVPDGMLNRQSDKKLRQFILSNCYLDALISLPENTFFRNSKKTYILSLTKKNNIFEKQTDPIFTYLVSEIGESRDIHRFDIEQDDLNEAVELFNSFKGNKKIFHKFQEIKPDKRCKLWNIEKFESETNWTVDRWWRKEELIELSIAKKENVADLNTFGELIENISDRLKGFSSSIKEIGKKETKPNDFKEILLSGVFEIKKGSSKYSNEFINKNLGEYPVYSSQTTNNGVIGKINSYDYDCECLTWTTDGIHAGTVFLRKEKFSITTHCGALIPKNKNRNLLLSYLYFYLSENLKEYAVGSQNKRITVEIIKNVKIKIPVNKEGEFDLVKQQNFAEKHQYIKELKKIVEEDKQKINNLTIIIERERERETISGKRSCYWGNFWFVSSDQQW